MRKYLLLLVLLPALWFATPGCRKDKVTAFSADCPDTISYATKVEPIIFNNCSISGCHNATGAGGYVFLNHSDISSNADRILSVIRHNQGFSPMPKFAPKLADSVIQDVKCWIDQGKQDN